MPKYDYIVDANGGGDFRTIREAIEAARKLGGHRYVIVRAGKYCEKLDMMPEVELHADSN